MSKTNKEIVLGKWSTAYRLKCTCCFRKGYNYISKKDGHVIGEGKTPQAAWRDAASKPTIEEVRSQFSASAKYRKENP